MPAGIHSMEVAHGVHGKSAPRHDTHPPTSVSQAQRRRHFEQQVGVSTDLSSTDFIGVGLRRYRHGLPYVPYVFTRFDVKTWALAPCKIQLTPVHPAGPRGFWLYA